MRTAKTLLVILGLVATAVPAYASSITYSYTTLATDDGPGDGITYTLDLDTVTGAATFTIDGATPSATEVWWADWFTFKFMDSTRLDLSLTSTAAGTGNWSVADVDTNSSVQVLKAGGGYTPLLTGGAGDIGFYTDSIASPAPDTVSDGVCLTSTHCTSDLPAVFKFTVALPSGWTDSGGEIPFKVGYYDGLTGSGAVIVSKLSRELGEEVPDGGTTLSLLGGALLGLGLLRRKFNL
jgi:hypothetical protein